eukprot:14258126-Alexandrium_andersonii.AAC.2
MTFLGGGVVMRGLSAHLLGHAQHKSRDFTTHRYWRIATSLSCSPFSAPAPNHPGTATKTGSSAPRGVQG